MVRTFTDFMRGQPMRTQAHTLIATPRVILAVLAWSMLAENVHTQEPLKLREMGMFYVGGEVRSAAGFEQHVDQALVHYLIPVTDGAVTPVVMYPGLGLSSYIFLSTPDGREG